MEEKANVKFRLVSIENERINKDFDNVTTENINGQELKFQYKVGTVIKMSEDTIVVIPSLRYLYNDKVIFEASSEFVYSIQTLATAIDIDRENKRINVKSNIFPSLLGSAYSTLRGISFVEAKDTPLAKYPAPMVEINTLLSKNGISIVE